MGEWNTKCGDEKDEGSPEEIIFVYPSVRDLWQMRPRAFLVRAYEGGRARWSLGELRQERRATSVCI